jgi:hypothetical protein
MEMAMVQVAENRADITGRVQSMRADPERPDYRIVTIEVHGTAPVEGYANMFATAAGSRLEVLVAADQTHALAPGKSGPSERLGKLDRWRFLVAHILTNEESAAPGSH